MDNPQNLSRTWWSNLKIGLIILSILCVASGTLFVLFSLGKMRENSENTCLNEKCMRLASHIRKNMDRSCHPCRDFFNFTCGNYMKNVAGPVGANFALYSMSIVYDKCMQLLEDKSQHWIPPAKSLQKFYKDCRNQNHGKNQKQYLEEMKNILLQLRWPPLMSNWKSYFQTDFNWLTSESLLIRKGLRNSFLEFSSITDILKKNKPNRLLLNCVPSIIPKSVIILSQENHMKYFIEMIRDFIRLINGREILAEEIAHTFLAIERIKQRSSHHRKRNLYHLIPEFTLDDLGRYWNINLTQFCYSIFPSSLNITNSTSIVLLDHCAADLVFFLRHTENRSIASYMFWEVALDLMWIVSDETRNLQQKLTNLFFGNKKLPSLQINCYYIIDNYLPDLMSYLYVKSYYSKERKAKITEMVDLVIDQVENLVRESWLDDQTKDMLHRKVQSINYVVDHVEEFFTDQYIVSTFIDLHFNTSNIIETIKNIKAHSFKRKWKVFLLDPKKRLHSQVYPITVNAFYDLATNQMVIPASVALGILFSEDFEGYLNFGGLGSVIGHEIFHSIDSASVYFNDKLEFGNWFSLKSKAAFLDKTRCFVDQYDNYELLPNVRVNGTLTLTENISDAGGVLLAYRAYLKWLETHKVRKLPGLGAYTDRQLFWMMYGNLWCEKYNIEYLQQVYFNNDVHTIGKFRVIGSLSNIQDFSNDFNCSPNSNMNPREKCKLYR